MKCLFLDVDGVLNSVITKDVIPDTCYRGIENAKVKLLKKIIDATGASIILTSTWRLNVTHWGQDISEHKDYLKKKLSKQGLRYVSQTPNLECRGNNRGKEIHQWIETNNDIDIEGWVILDDEYFMDYDNYDIPKHLVLTDEYIGLTEVDVEKAIKILNGERR